MFGLRKTFVLSTLFLSVFSSPTHPSSNNDIVDWNEFRALLDNLDDTAIHHALHSVGKFKDGVFSKDRSAIEQVHSENPVIASKLVKLAKRQSGSNSTTTAASVSPTTPAQSSLASESSSRAASVSSVLSSAIAASTVPPPTTIEVAPTTPKSAVPIATSGGKVIFSTIGGGLVTLTSSPARVSFRPSTSTHLYYTTLADGKLHTSTSVVVVNAPITAGGGNAAAATGTDSGAASTGHPGLQSAASRPANSFVTELLMLLGGAAAWILAL